MELNKIYTGDAKELAKEIPDESVDLVFADPVYSEIEDYRWLGALAYRVLKPGGALLAWSSTPRAAHCQVAIEESGLDYVYTLNYVVPAKPYRLMHYHLFLWTTPCLWFQKGHSVPNRWITDTVINQQPPTGEFKWNKNNNVLHNWVDAFTRPGDLVLDPFTGTGPVPQVCKQLGRNFIAFELEPERAAMARERVATTPMPLFVLEPEQLTMGEAV